MLRLLALLALLFAFASPAHATKRIAFSFDDVPRQAGGFMTPEQRARRLTAGLRRGGIRQAGFFVTTGNLNKPAGANGAAHVRAYARAGHVIANHSHGHLWLRRTDAPAYLADLDRAEAWLRAMPGKRPWFRFPYLDEGGRETAKRDAIRAGLRERGLMSAYVTVDNYDWHLDLIAGRAHLEGKRLDMAALRDLYTETMVGTANFYDRIARETLGRSPAHVILLHETDLAALFIADLARAFRADGWHIIGIDEAYRDPIARIDPDTWFLGSGRVAALAHVAGRQPRDLVHERTDEEVLNRLLRDRVLKEPAP